MKKTLLLSVVASTMIMAGGDIAPVEPAVEAPAEVAAWEFSGTAKLYYQTDDAGISGDASDDSLFSQGASSANAGIQLRATNADLAYGIGAGVELSGVATLGLQEDVVSGIMQGAGAEFHLRGGWVSQAYLTYSMDNTSFKLGRQELPKSLSPFAYSESWNVWKNTFDSLLIVNTDLPDTTLVGAWVKGANFNFQGSDMALFLDVNDMNGENGIFMLTAQNKSIEDLTLTGTVYYGSEYITTDDLTILWGDAQYAAGDFGVGIQGGTVMHDALLNDTVAFGAKITASVSDIDLMGAYSNVNDGDLGMFQIGGTTSALYTNTVANQLVANAFEFDSDKFVVSAAAGVLGGNLSAAYAYTDSAVTDSTNEVDVVYSTNVSGIDLTAAYVYLDADAMADSANIVRLIGSYNF